ncbi:LPXTG cell wall anchor domain-containing protein, partial [Liquorilactobacillus mali]|uniref:LPXTG cell wall anchor domain-containing protein n=1 Tax=Liquorilactobacillus mali TaxID=1618 RepID=UPI002654A774
LQGNSSTSRHNFDADKEYNFTVDLQTTVKIASVSVTDKAISTNKGSNGSSTKPSKHVASKQSGSNHTKRHNIFGLPQTGATRDSAMTISGIVILVVVVVMGIFTFKRKRYTK